MSVAVWFLRTGLGIGTITVMSLVVIMIGGLGILVTRWVRSAAPPLFAAAFTWVVAAVFLSPFIVTTLSMFAPERFIIGTRFLSKILATPELFGTDKERRVADLSQTALSDYSRELTETGVDRLAALSERGTISIAGRQEMTGPAVIRAYSLRMESAEIVTQGYDLTIEVLDLIIDGTSGIASFDNYSAVPNSPGKQGGRVKLVIRRRIVGELMVNLSGTRGGDGTPGAPGAPGGRGADGDNAVSSLFDCKSGAGRGRDGGPGGPGRPGSDGFQGGDGGELKVQSVNPTADRAAIQFIAQGGKGGRGGGGGPGGPGGPGGSGGGPRGLCSGGGPNGNQGPWGAQGPDGASGARGADGKFLVEKL